MIAERRVFADRPALAAALAHDAAETLRTACGARGSAVLAVSGGTTPVRFFEALSESDLPWSAVTVTLVDDRQVPETSERSNARLVRTHLLAGRAGAARLVPLVGNASAAAALPRFDFTVLGMGGDGHTASFFPGSEDLARALDLPTEADILALSAPGAPEPRVTFTLRRLLESDRLALHIEGEEKRRVLQVAEGEGPVEAMPIRAFLRAPKPLTLYWCP
jgi:6-phosphogluconolactonase